MSQAFEKISIKQGLPFFWNFFGDLESLQKTQRFCICHQIFDATWCSLEKKCKKDKNRFINEGSHDYQFKTMQL